MTDSKTDAPAKSPVETAVEHAVDALVYAPIGLLFDGASLLPQLIEKGRNQVTMARMLGRFAVEQGRDEATKAASKLQDQAAGVLEFIGGSVAPVSGEEPAPPARPVARRPARERSPGAAKAAARKVAGVDPAAETATAGATAAPSAPAPPGPAPDVSGLAIPDYDGLSASHVVNRLAGLSQPELEAVRAYEAANRGRKTILSKVAQLQSA